MKVAGCVGSSRRGRRGAGKAGGGGEFSRPTRITVQTFDANWAGACRLLSGENYAVLSLEVPENRSRLQPTSTKVTQSCNKLSNLQILTASRGAFLLCNGDLLHLVHLHAFKTKTKICR